VRRRCVAGNWKMNLERRSALELCSALRERLGARNDVHTAVAPPFVYLADVAKALEGSAIQVGAQDVADRASGAFTGEVSAAMLRDVGVSFAIVGHSERRHVYGEGDELANAKLLRALEEGLDVILCLGETLEERKAKRTESVVSRQLTRGLDGVKRDDLGRVTLAYEPVWAIGTGLNATSEQASAVHQYLRGVLSGLYDEAAAEAQCILYGGSVGPANAAALLGAPDVDGALVGGASLKSETFLPIIDSAHRAR